MTAINPPNEAERIKNLKSYEILDSTAEASFDAITSLASQIVDCPIALISLVDEKRQWFKSKVGIDVSETPREISFCAHAILSPEAPLIIPDASKDPRFYNNPLVCAAPSIRFYAGFPVVTEEGYCIGTLCVIDHQPRTLDDKQMAMLELLAKQASALLKLHRKKSNLLTFSQVVNQSNNMVAVLDNTFHYEYANPMFLQRSGYTSEEVIGKNVSKILIGPKTEIEDLDALLRATKNREKKEREICLHDKAGEPFWVKMAISPVFDDAGFLRKYIGVLVDITDFKQRQEVLMQAKEEAQEAVKLKEQFLSNMSHEIRTPMNGIIGLSEILLGENDLIPKHKELVSHINYSAESLLNILNDILDFSKMNAEKMKFQNINFDLPKIFEHMEGSLGFLAKQKGIDFKVNIDKKLPRYVSGDPTRFNQILRNIIGNAVKFTELGGVDIDVDLIEYTIKGPKISVSVTDTGVGIPAHRLDAIFNVFEQAHDYTASKFGGTGLGMSIAKKLIERFDGELKIDSQEGIGTTCAFTVQLNNPIIEQIEHQPSLKSQESESDQAHFRILVADDNMMNQIVARSGLEKMGYQVDVAENGKECIDLFKKGHYDLILMDVQMPVMNGLDATREIRHLDKKIPILAMTASVMEHDKRKCYEAGMNQTVVKPIKPKLLHSIILNYLSKNMDQDPKMVH